MKEDPRQKLLDELEEIEARREQIVRELETITCTGISAAWCPLCGDCICRDEEGNAPDGLDHPDCPLHAFASPHAEDLPAAIARSLRGET